MFPKRPSDPTFSQDVKTAQSFIADSLRSQSSLSDLPTSPSSFVPLNFGQPVVDGLLIQDINILSDSFRKTLDSQERFLLAFANLGTILRAAPVAGISRGLVQTWRNQDVLGFKLRFRNAQDAFGEKLEQRMFELLEKLESGQTPILLIFALKGWIKARYGDQSVVSDSESQVIHQSLKRLVDEARRKDNLKATGATEAKQDETPHEKRARRDSVFPGTGHQTREGDLDPPEPREGEEL